MILHGPALEGDATMVSVLLKEGTACLGGRESDGMTLFHAAA